MAESMNYLQQIAARIRKAVPAGPDSPEDESLYLIYATLLLAKGRQVTSSDVHDAWATWMTIRGEDHESIVPFDELSDEVRSEDLPFVAAIRAVACAIFTPTEERYRWELPNAASVVIEEPLFLSNYCELWRGRTVGTEEAVVLKIARRDELDEGTAIIEREIAVRNEVSSEHLAEVLTTDRVDDGRAFVALRLYSLGSLADSIERTGHLSDVNQVASVARDIGSALVAIRNAGFVHSDVTPGNILKRSADPLGWVLTDLGMAVPTGASPVGGTDGFAPPELATGDAPLAVSEAWDVESLGQVLFLMITGENGQPGDDPGEPPTEAARPLWNLIRASISDVPVTLERFRQAAEMCAEA